MVTPLPVPVFATRLARDSAGARRERDRGTRGVCCAGFPADRGGNLSVAFAGTPPG